MSYAFKPVKCRKEHPCCFCKKPIRAGEIARVAKYRQPRFDSSDSQIGIEYVKFYMHTAEYEECTSDGEKFIQEPVNDTL